MSKSYLEILLSNSDDNIKLEKLHEIIEKYDNQPLIRSSNYIRHIKSNSSKSVFQNICDFLKYCCCCLCLSYCTNNNDDEEKKIDHFVGLINVGNNCYLNSGLQILSRCYPFIIELLKNTYGKNEYIQLLSEVMVELLLKRNKYYNPSKFIEYFCSINEDFAVGQQNCSQSFIRTILRNMNEMQDKTIRYEDYICNNFEEYSAYNKYIKENNIFPESKIYSIFSGITKMTISGECTECNEKLCNYSFNSFIDQMIYLNAFSEKCRFYEVLKKNIGQKNKAKMQCYKCKRKINAIAISKFVKIPEIFIFTLERYLIRNKVPIEPDEKINIFDLVDESLSIDRNDCYYELFAINIRLGNDLSFGHEICQIKENNNWYTINDKNYNLKNKEYYEYSYGFFYKKMKRGL